MKRKKTATPLILKKRLRRRICPEKKPKLNDLFGYELNYIIITIFIIIML